MKWLIGYNDLDREQHMFLDGGRMENGDYKKPFIERSANEHIQGFPGSGKTVLMLYSVAAAKKQDPKAKILIIEFTHSLIKMLQAALKELVYQGKKIDTSDVNVVTYYDFWSNYSSSQHYDLILCDEVQDVPLKVITRMRQCSERVVVAGDHNQSIYEKDPKWGQKPCTTSEINSAIEPAETSLKILHRLCRSIANAIESFMPNMKIMNGRIPMIKDNVQIRLWKSSRGQSQEAKSVIEDAIETLNINDSVGILLPNHNKIIKFANRALEALGKEAWEPSYCSDDRRKYDFEDLNEHLRKQGLPMQYVANGFGSFEGDDDKIVLTTYHSSKGLDFDKVFLPFCNHTDEWSKYDEMTQRVFMVAMTRSRKDLILSYSGELDKFVETFKEQCSISVLGDDAPKLPGLEEVESDNSLFGF